MFSVQNFAALNLNASLATCDRWVLIKSVNISVGFFTISKRSILYLFDNCLKSLPSRGPSDLTKKPSFQTINNVTTVHHCISFTSIANGDKHMSKGLNETEWDLLPETKISHFPHLILLTF